MEHETEVCKILSAVNAEGLLTSRESNSVEFKLSFNLGDTVTTHNYECVSAAVEEDASLEQSLLSYVRLASEDGCIVPYSFSKDDLAFALERERRSDIRG
ncbi:MAG: hypothetical protein FWG02_06910 [Holophagaceae bacterium]|nr:hypothetical protein [Holophagaceae bacterium]